MPRSNRARRGGRPVSRPGGASRPGVGGAGRTGAGGGAGGNGGAGANGEADGDDDGWDISRSLRGMERRETHPDGDWMVRRVTGAASSKSYTCPGCRQQIRPAVPHVVAWPVDGPGSWLDGGDVAQRRHWHTACWSRRDRLR